jgi:lipopolysaccharide/colanic/teichoic acid biosynthesis glycosyltransferase
MIVMKRGFDIVASVIGLICFLPLLLLLAVLIKLDSTGPVFFKQERVGKGFRPFLIYKFRTMVKDAPQLGSMITFGKDSRITRIGWLLRKSKLDELPQLFNILKGDMSFVGPRPEVLCYVGLFSRDYEQILKVRPGLTDLASLKYSDEAAILGRSENPQDEYVGRLLPDKIRLAKEYIRRSSFIFDLRLIFGTIIKLFGYRERPLGCWTSESKKELGEFTTETRRPRSSEKA